MLLERRSKINLKRYHAFFVYLMLGKVSMKKNILVADMSANGEGGGSTPFPKVNFFYFVKEIKLQNVLNVKICILEEFRFTLNCFLSNRLF